MTLDCFVFRELDKATLFMRRRYVPDGYGFYQGVLGVSQPLQGVRRQEIIEGAKSSNNYVMMMS